MILADTSVWIQAFRGHGRRQAELDRILNEKLALGHEFVFGELMLGGTRDTLLKQYQKIGWLQRIPHVEVVQFVEAHRLRQRGVGWIDIHLLASARAFGASLWTMDNRLRQVAAELGIAWPAR